MSNQEVKEKAVPSLFRKRASTELAVQPQQIEIGLELIAQAGNPIVSKAFRWVQSARQAEPGGSKLSMLLIVVHGHLIIYAIKSRTVWSST